MISPVGVPPPRKPRRTIRRRIVAEISKGWINTNDGSGARSATDDKRLLSELFELCIETNRQRGYELESWQLQNSTSAIGDCRTLSETIVAVFVSVSDGA